MPGERINAMTDLEREVVRKIARDDRGLYLMKCVTVALFQTDHGKMFEFLGELDKDFCTNMDERNAMRSYFLNST